MILSLGHTRLMVGMGEDKRSMLTLVLNLLGYLHTIKAWGEGNAW